MIMSSCFLKILYALLLLLMYVSGSILEFNLIESVEIKCIKRERQALLNFKQGLEDDYGMLSTWRDDENNGDCCKWKGIECNNETGHILSLHLRGQYPQYYLTGGIDITSLIDLKNLEYLDLSGNNFLMSHIPELIGSFTKLRYLDLSFSKFDGNVPSKLGELTLLQYLDLSLNELVGEIPYQLGNLSQLQYLDLYRNSLSGAIPFQIGNLPSLHTLRLSGNFSVKTKDVEWLSNLYSLKSLELTSFHNLGSSHRWLQTINKLIPNLSLLRLFDCSLVDNDIRSLFDSHSNFSSSLTILDLSENMLTSSPFQLLFNYSLNLQELYLSDNNIVFSSPLYPNFPSLLILDLSRNNMASLIVEANFNFSSKLRELHLRNCSLTDGNFGMSSASVVNSLPSLFILDLSFNLLKSSTIFHWLSNFTTNLHSLDLSSNLLEGPIPDDEFGKVIKSLEVLKLGYNKLQGNIPSSFGNICTLQELYLGSNNLSGEIPNFIQNSSWCNRYKIQVLDLSYNWISGMLPNLSILSSLKRLKLSKNQLIGEIPKSIGLLYELEYLDLEGNYLKGDINESHFNNLFKLTDLVLTDNSLSLMFNTSWVPPFQLVNLGLASCKMGPSFPSWLQTQRQLSFLDISNAGINDSVPEWFWNNLQFIDRMNLSYNNLIGIIPNLPFKYVDDGEKYVILNSNQFEGRIPAFLSQASTLDLSKNKFSDLNTFLCEKSATKYMSTLDFSNNQIMGQLPDCWEHLNSLESLDLSNNKLSGKIPESMGVLANLKALILRNNSLIGKLPPTLRNCTSLLILDLGENLLSGPIPSWIGESLQKLKILSLRVNRFYGCLPSYICYLRQIQLLDLSRNNLSKGIPTCLKNFTTMMERSTISGYIVRGRKISSEAWASNIYESNVLLTWKGIEHVYWNPEILLKSIDLSSNNLTGEIPKEVGYLLGLVSLNLSRNYLSGEIPSEIGNLSSLDFLDLSRNHFSGRIPSSLSQIDRLSVLDLSYNSLSGRIPLGRQLQTFDASRFEGNIDLCGEPLNKSCPGDVTPAKPQGPTVHDEDEDDNSNFYEALYMSLGIGFFTGFWGFLGPILIWRPWRNAYLRLLNRVTDYIYVMVVVNVAKCHRWLKG